MSEITITKENFVREVMQSTEPVLVDFWASWCAPCRMLAPVLAEIAQEGSCKVGKINVDTEGELAAQFGVSSIPTVLCFKNGKIVSSMVGYHSKREVLGLLTAN